MTGMTNEHASSPGLVGHVALLFLLQQTQFVFFLHFDFYKNVAGLAGSGGKPLQPNTAPLLLAKS